MLYTFCVMHLNRLPYELAAAGIPPHQVTFGMAAVIAQNQDRAYAQAHPQISKALGVVIDLEARREARSAAG